MDIYEYIKSSEQAYNTIPVPVVENYEWHMLKHIKLTTLYLNSQYESGNKEMKPFRNIVLPAVNLQHRAVEFAVKEIDFFIDDADEFYKAFLVRKFHQKWARENMLANFLDELTETYTDYGGVLIKKGKDAVPQVVPFQQIAFCDQTDILSGPICLKHQFNPDQLKEMEAFGWGSEANGATATIDDIITMAQTGEKTSTQTVPGLQAKTPGKYIEIYELHGVLPKKYLVDNIDGVVVKDTDYILQMHIIGMYRDTKGNKQGVTLFKGKRKNSIFKFFKRDPIFGRALGRGAVEELFDPQVWVNYSAITQKEMLDQASKVLYQTDDQSFIGRNQTNETEQGEILVTGEGKSLSQINTSAPNLVAFENSLREWNETAKSISASYDSITGSDQKSGTPFRSTALLNNEAHSLHRYRKGKIGGIFLPEVYKDWILPEIRKVLSNDQEFSALLSLEEMEQISDSVITNSINEHIKGKILNGFLIDPGEVAALQTTYKDLFFKKGNQKFFQIFKDDLKDLPIEISVNITNEEKNGALVAEQLASIFTQLVPVLGANPQFFEQNPKMGKLFNDIIENSGLNPMAYVGKANPLPAPVALPGGAVPGAEVIAKK